MVNPDISAVVSSILSSFGTGMDLFRRLQGKKQLKRLQREEKTKGGRRSHDSLHHRHKRKQRKSPGEDHGNESGGEEAVQDQLLRKSLEQAPEDIRREYETSVQR